VRILVELIINLKYTKSITQQSINI